VEDKTTMHHVFQGSGAAHKGKSQDGLSDLWIKHDEYVIFVVIVLAFEALTISSSPLPHTPRFLNLRRDAA